MVRPRDEPGPDLDYVTFDDHFYAVADRRDDREATPGGLGWIVGKVPGLGDGDGSCLCPLSYTEFDFVAFDVDFDPDFSWRSVLHRVGYQFAHGEDYPFGVGHRHARGSEGVSDSLPRFDNSFGAWFQRDCCQHEKMPLGMLACVQAIYPDSKS